MLLSDNDDKRLLFENCRLKAKRVVNPIIDWTDSDVWQYIADQKICTCCLYKEGFDRVGCIGCPLAKNENREFEFNRYPQYKKNYINAFQRMMERRISLGRVQEDWRMGMTGQEVFNWWMQYKIDPDQIDLLQEKEEE